MPCGANVMLSSVLLFFFFFQHLIVFVKAEISCYKCNLIDEPGCIDQDNLERFKVKCTSSSEVCVTSSVNRACGNTDEVMANGSKTECKDDGLFKYFGNKLCCAPATGSTAACNNQPLPPLMCDQCNINDYFCKEPGIAVADLHKKCADVSARVCKTTNTDRKCGDAGETADNDGNCFKDKVKQEGICCIGYRCNNHKFPSIKCKQCKIERANPNANDEKCRVGDLEPTLCGADYKGNKNAYSCQAIDRGSGTYERRCADNHIFADAENRCEHKSVDSSRIAGSFTMCCAEGDEKCAKIPIPGSEGVGPQTGTTAAPELMECFYCLVDGIGSHKKCPDNTTAVETCKAGVRQCVLERYRWRCGDPDSPHDHGDRSCETAKCNIEFVCHVCDRDDKRLCDQGDQVEVCEEGVKVCKYETQRRRWGCARSESDCSNHGNDICCFTSRCNSDKTKPERKEPEDKKNKKGWNYTEATDGAVNAPVSLAPLLLSLALTFD